ncbi:MAG: carboxylesterase family protein [Crocinitomicaceae bacterium]|nr:carboxylesterase family protein [Crocinitomicaceae bacterium]
MKKVYLLGLAVATYFSSIAQFNCTGGRYDVEVFPNLDITTDVQYGSNLNNNGNNTQLLVDIYEPSGDTESSRPLIIFMHGGTFIAGSKDGDDVKPLAEMFAKKGYVTASISYRLGMDNLLSITGPSEGDASEAVFRATQDARAAVRFFRKSVADEGNPYGIDPDNIYLVGSSAGGFMALHLAYLTDPANIPSSINFNKPGLTGGLEGDSGSPGFPSDVKAIVNLAGALGDANWMQAGDTPVLSLHGDQDETVPFGTDMISVVIFDIIVVDGSLTVHTKAEGLGLKHCFKPFFGAGHVPHVNNQAYTDTTELYITEFLLSFVCGQADYCPCGTAADPVDCFEFQGLSLDELLVNDVNLYPNPASNVFTIDANAPILDYTIYSLGGQLVTSADGNFKETIKVDCSHYPNGMYLVQVRTERGLLQKKLIIE